MDESHLPASPNTVSRKQNLALIADDDITNRLVLKSMLRKKGFDVVEAENGEQAVNLFRQHQPDIIFMDIMMPVMDGYEATRHIKLMSDEDFVPIIFLTAITDEKQLARCIEVGGDDFLTKPFSKILLNAKIDSMERIRELHRQVGGLYRQIQHEEEIAERVFSNAVTRGNVDIEQMETLLQPAAIFSGDMLLTAFSPSRDIHLLLADFTGHGLSAALGALPASEVFRSMTAKGFAIEEILNTMNNKLHVLLPTGMFMTAQFVTISHDLDHVTVCNCGMPDILLLGNRGRKIKHRIKSAGLPLGIDPDFDYSSMSEHVDLEIGDRVVLVSDGVHEASNQSGQLFGQARFEQALSGSRGSMERLKSELDEFCASTPQSDDISLIEVHCIPEILPAWDLDMLLNEHAGDIAGEDPVEDNNLVEFSLVFNGTALVSADPIPQIVSHLQSLSENTIPHQALFTILTELFVNALDHGVLDLDSTMKGDAEGFLRYFKERELRINSLQSGFIRFDIEMYQREKQVQLIIRVEDSGQGFDYSRISLSEGEEGELSGRGIRLLQQLCDSVSYSGSGNQVEVVYRWDIE